MNTKFTFLLQLKAKPGKEAEVESFLKGEAKLVSGEPGTITWHAAKDESEPGSYFVFDTFNDKAAREAHMNGEAGKEFVANKDRLFSEVNPTFSTRRQNALFFGKKRPPRRLNKGTGSQKCL